MGSINWMKEGPFGVMVHWTQRTLPRCKAPEPDWNKRVNQFPVDSFAAALAEAGAKWLIFTVGHFGDFCAPNSVIEAFYPGHCSQRDLVCDLSEALHSRGIRLIVYFQTEVNHETEDMRQAFCWNRHPSDKRLFQKRWTDVLHAYAVQWGMQIDGWWFDSCYDMNYMSFVSDHGIAGWDNSRFGDGEDWLTAARAGNPQAVVAMNQGVACLRHEPVLASGEDYLAGESNTLDVRPVQQLQDGRQWHGLIWTDCPWGHFESPGDIEPPRFSDDELYDYLAECHRKGGAVTFNIGIYQDGQVAGRSLAQLKRLRALWLIEYGNGTPLWEPSPGDLLADAIRNKLQSPINRIFFAKPKGALAIDFRDQVRTGHWTETWPEAGAPVMREVSGEIWNPAIQCALDQAGGVFLPAQPNPYYLDGPILLKSGQFIIADPTAQIRLKPDVNTCMVRNEHVASFQNSQVPDNLEPDTGIYIEGGIWTTLATMETQRNGNIRGRADSLDSAPGAHGVFLLNNVQQFVVRNLTVRQSTPFAIHVSIAREFLIENIRLDEQRRDGVHLQGHTHLGVVRNVKGVTEDDFIALNAWEWANYAPCFGTISKVLVENIRPDGIGWDTIRMLPGVKRFHDGSIADCTISDIVIRRINGIEWIFSVNQPNLELGREHDSSLTIGNLRNIHIDDMTITRKPTGFASAGSGPIRLHVDVDGFFLRNVKVMLPDADRDSLVEIGPLSLTIKLDPANPDRWVEVYSPDLDCTVSNLRLDQILIEKDGRWEMIANPYSLVKTIHQRINGDFPNSIPRGGTGKGIWILPENLV